MSEEYTTVLTFFRGEYIVEVCGERMDVKELVSTTVRPTVSMSSFPSAFESQADALGVDIDVWVDITRV